MRWKLLILMGLLAAVNAAGQGQYCSVVELGATGRVQLDIPGGGERYGSARFSYRTTGSPTGVSITIEGGNELASVQTPFTAVPAMTSTTGDTGTAAGGWRHWFANVGTLSGGTAPRIILRYCLHVSAFSIARFATAPTFSSMTEGSVLFAGPSGLLSQDNANFFWDNTPKNLLIGGSLGVGLSGVPAERIEVRAPGAVRIKVNDTADGVDTKLIAQAGLGAVGTGSNTDFSLISNNLTRLLVQSGGGVRIDFGIAQGGGLKHQRVTTGSCATTGCSVTLTWTAAFTDANYTANCSVEDSTAQAETTGLRFAKIRTKVAASVTVDLDNFSGSAITGTLHCIAMRD